ncbi:MAG: hypothetical protein IKV83_00415 [Muribaculaceae bacterium]|nr:hypothetical protein [Muribaculaceae bacterium]
MEIKESYIRNIVDNVINEFLSEQVNTSEHSQIISEMATFGSAKWGKNIYKIAIHGISAGDRSVPHIHVYLQNERNTRAPMFNFEVSLFDILEKDEINLIYQKDVNRNILIKNRRNCSWTGYADIYQGLKEFLAKESDVPVFGNIISNLGRAIYEWNKETDYNDTINNRINILGHLFTLNGKTVHPKYQTLLQDYPPKFKK